MVKDEIKKLTLLVAAAKEIWPETTA